MHVLLLLAKFAAAVFAFAWAVSLPTTYKTLWVPRPVAWVYRMVTRPLYGGQFVDAVTVGHMILVLGTFTADLLEHEEVHVGQAKEREPQWWPRWLGRAAVGTLIYWAAYLLEFMRHGYYDNRFEVEAREAAGQTAEKEAS